MPLSDDVIEQAVQRYRRELDRYRKMATVMDIKCRRIVRDLGIRAAVSSRAKEPDSFRRKLLLPKYKDSVQLNSVDDVFSRVRDLAAARVTTYVESDRDDVVAAVVAAFRGPNGADVVADKKDRDDRFYRATHCDVALREDDLVAPNENLEGLVAEIQVCSLLAHVWNEIEHDLVYKPQAGEPSGSEKRLLDALGEQMLAGDHVIMEMLSATEKRLAEQTGAIRDVFDFFARVGAKFFPEATSFGRHAAELLEELLAQGLDTPEKIERDLGLNNNYIARSADLLNRVDIYARAQEAPFRLETQSSDVLLVLFLERHADDVLERHPMGPGLGRPLRIASIAKRVKEMLAPPPAVPPG